jgi:competence protein ComEA
VIPRFALAAGLLGLAGFALWHPAGAPIAQSAATPLPQPSYASLPEPLHRRHGARAFGDDGDPVVYVTGAVKRPGLYRLHSGDRDAQAIVLAGGLSAAADTAGVNLAQRVADGDEIDVPAAGEAPLRRAGERHGRHRSPRHPPPEASVDVNQSNADELAAVPGIGHAIAQRIVELREREGSFATLDELLDVAGMTQSRLERARPYLRRP